MSALLLGGPVLAARGGRRGGSRPHPCVLCISAASRVGRQAAQELGLQPSRAHGTTMVWTLCEARGGAPHHPKSPLTAQDNSKTSRRSRFKTKWNGSSFLNPICNHVRLSLGPSAPPPLLNNTSMPPGYTLWAVVSPCVPPHKIKIRTNVLYVVIVACFSLIHHA